MDGTETISRSNTGEPGDIILLVEDDENDVVLLTKSFDKAGLKQALHRVCNGVEAIQYLAGEASYADRQQHPFPCLLLLDLKLPLKNGFEVLAWVRSQPATRRLLVTVLTASKEVIDVRQAYDLLANSYLVKPTTIAGLDEVARKVKEYWLELNVNPYSPVS